MEARSVRSITKALNDAGVRYLIVGGLAVNVHGYVRMTRDLDLVVALDPGNIRRCLATLLAEGYQLAVPVSVEEFADPGMRARWREEKGMLVLKLWSDAHARTPIDIFIYEPFDFSAELTRSLRVDLAPGIEAPIVSLATLVAMKQEAARPQDLVDIQELTRIR